MRAAQLAVIALVCVLAAPIIIIGLVRALWISAYWLARDAIFNNKKGST